MEAFNTQGAAQVSMQEASDSASSVDATESKTAAGAGKEAPEPLVISDSGWDARDSYVHFGIMVENPNAQMSAWGAKLIVIGKDSSGAVLFEEESDVSLVGAGSSSGFAGKAGNGWEPASVEFALVQDAVEWREDDSFVEPFPIVDFAEKDLLYYRYELQASLRNDTADYASTVPVSVIMRDADGAIVSGYAGAAYRVKPGRTKGFVMTMNSAPDHASVEVYAHPAP